MKSMLVVFLTCLLLVSPVAKAGLVEVSVSGFIDWLILEDENVKSGDYFNTTFVYDDQSPTLAEPVIYYELSSATITMGGLNFVHNPALDSGVISFTDNNAVDAVISDITSVEFFTSPADDSLSWIYLWLFPNLDGSATGGSDASLSIIDQIVYSAQLSNVVLGFEGNYEGDVIVQSITMTDVSAVPVPAALYLFISGILGTFALKKVRS